MPGGPANQLDVIIADVHPAGQDCLAAAGGYRAPQRTLQHQNYTDISGVFTGSGLTTKRVW